MTNNLAYAKKVKELAQICQKYEIHLSKDLDNKNIQKFLQKCYKRYENFCCKKYPKPKYPDLI